MGAVAGVAANALVDSERLETFVAYVTEPIGKIFLRLLLMLALPLLFSALAVGIAGMELRSLGRIGLKTLAYAFLLSAIAVCLGVGLVNLVRPGEGVSAELRDQLAASAPPPARTEAPTGVAFFVGLVPDNPVKAMAEGNMIGVILFALFVGVGLALTGTPAARRLRDVLEGVYDVSMKLIGIVIGMAPIGVGALVFTTTARLGAEILRGLGAYVAVVLVALALHQFVVYSLAVRVLGGMSPLRFFRAIRMAMLTAFSTASSNATLPTAIQVADEELKLPKSISRFVLTVGATMNQNGTALFEGVTVLFLAQLYGVELTLDRQFVVVAICVLAGIGTAGVPAGMLPVLMTILATVDVPPDGVGLILGVDRFLDMCRTTLNVTGDLAAAVVVSRGAGAEPGGLAPELASREAGS